MLKHVTNKEYSALIEKHTLIRADGRVVACLYIQKADGELHADSWVRGEK